MVKYLVKKQKVVLKAPEILCLYSNPDETTLFLHGLYHKTTVLHVDFSQTKYITAAAALAIFAHVNNIQQGKNNAACFVFDCKKSIVYKNLFIKTGFLNALRMGSKYDTENRLFRFGAFVDIDRIRQETFLQLDEYKEKFRKQSNIESEKIEAFFIHLRQSIKEVLLNIGNHAYFDDSLEETGYDSYRDKMWWQMFWYDAEKKQIHFIIYDLGVGIANSYTQYATEERSQIYQDRTHLEIIQEAIKPGMSRIINAGRGVGWSFITEPIDKLTGSNLFLRTGISGCAFNSNDEQEWFSYRDDLTGTLVEWSFQLPE